MPMDQEQRPSEQNNGQSGQDTAAKESRTRMVEQRIKEAADFSDSVERIKDQFVQKSVRDYFQQLLAKRSLTSAEVVNRADLDKDFGRQVLNGERKTRRDNYIRLGLAMNLAFPEIQSMLKYVQTGQIYVVRQRDAAIMFCIERKYGLMDTQLMLDEFGFEPLGDGGFYPDDDIPLKDEAQTMATRHIEQIIQDASDFSEVLDNTEGKMLKGSVEQYFDDMLARKNIQKKDLFTRTGISPNLGYQLLRGIRKSKNRDVYLKIAIEAELTLDETQQMLKLLNVGAIYPLRERDAVVYYGMTHGYNLVRIQALLAERGQPPL